MNRLALILTSSLLAASAGSALPLPGNAPALELAPPKPDVRELTVSPAALDSHPLRYRLRVWPGMQTEGDAAPLYLQACLMLDAIPASDIEKVVALFESEPATFDMSAAYAVTQQFRSTAWPSIQIATSRTRCEWGSTIRDQGAAALLPELGKLRHLARLLSVQARVQILSSKFADAAESIRAEMELGRRLGRGPTLIHASVGLGVCTVALDRVESFIRQPGSPNLYWALSELPQPLVNLSEPVQAACSLPDFTMPELRKIESGELGQKDAPTVVKRMISLSSFFGEPTPPQDDVGLLAAAATAAAFPRAKQRLIETGLKPADIDAMPASYVVLRANIDEFRWFTDRIQSWAARPINESLPELFALDAQIRALNSGPSGNMLANSLRTIDRSFLAQLTLQRRLEMLRTVEAIRLHAAATGKPPARLADITLVPIPKDPWTLQPFVYTLDTDTVTLSAEAPACIPPESATSLTLRVTIRK